MKYNKEGNKLTNSNFHQRMIFTSKINKTQNDISISN